jgi:hypothetical protein
MNLGRTAFGSRSASEQSSSCACCSFFSREITINAQNRDFERTQVDSKIVSEQD